MTAERTYDATVVDNADPDRQGRLKLAIPGLLEEEASEHPDWIPGCFVAGPTGGLILIPPVGAIVTVISDRTGTGLRWQGAPLSGRNVLPALLRASYPSRAGVVSPDGSSGVYVGTGEAGIEADQITLGASRDHGLLLTGAFLPDLNTVLQALAVFLTTSSTATAAPQIAAAAATFLASIGGPPGTLATGITTSLTAGAPYLSVRTKGD